MRKFHHIIALVLLATALPSWGAEAPDLDGITMEVLRNNDAREVIHDIKLPPELEKRLEQHTRPGGKSSKEERHVKQKEDKREKREKRERKDGSDARQERTEEFREAAEEMKEDAEDSRDEAEENETEVEDGS